MFWQKILWAKGFFFSSAAFAALPPLAQSCREIQAIVESAETYNRLGGAERIEHIQRTEKGYLLVTKSKELLIDIRYVRAGRPGPAAFELYFYEPVDTED